MKGKDVQVARTTLNRGDLEECEGQTQSDVLMNIQNMALPPEHLRPMLFQWEQEHYANLLREQHNKLNQARETATRQNAGNQTRGYVDMMSQPRMMPPATAALVESMRNLYQAGMVGNSSQVRPGAQPRVPPPLYSNVPRASIGSHNHPRGPPPLINPSIRQPPPPAHSNPIVGNSLQSRLGQTSTSNQFMPDMLPHMSQPSAQNRIRPDLPSRIIQSATQNHTRTDIPSYINPQSTQNYIRSDLPPHLNQPSTQNHMRHQMPPSSYINQNLSRNQVQSQGPSLQSSVDTIRITNPFENELNIPRTRTSPNFSPDIPMSLQGNINSLPGTNVPNINSRGYSTLLNVNSNNSLPYSQSGNPNDNVRQLNTHSALFQQQFPLSGFLPRNSAQNYSMSNTQPRMPVPSIYPFSEFNLMPPVQAVVSCQNPVLSCQNEEVSDRAVMGKWYKPPSPDKPEAQLDNPEAQVDNPEAQADKLEAQVDKSKTPEPNFTVESLIGDIVKKEFDSSENKLDRIHRPSKATHSNLERVVDQLFRQKDIVSPLSAIASTFPMTRESPTQALDTVATTTAGQDEVYSKNRGDAITSPVIYQQPLEKNIVSMATNIESPKTPEFPSDKDLLKSQDGMGLCILNSYSLAFENSTSPQTSNTDSAPELGIEEDIAEVPTASTKGKKKSLSPKKVPPLKIKLTFNRGSPKKLGFGSQRKTFGSPVKSAYHHFAKGAKKLIEIRKPKALMFDKNEKDQKRKSQADNLTKKILETTNDQNSNVQSKVELKSLDDVVAKVKGHRKRRRSAVLLDSTGSAAVTGKNVSGETDGIPPKKKRGRKPKNAKNDITNPQNKVNLEKNSETVDKPKETNANKELINEMEESSKENHDDSSRNKEVSITNEAVSNTSKEISNKSDNVSSKNKKVSYENQDSVNDCSSGTKDLSDNLSKEERNRELIEKNWVQIEARLKLMEKRIKEGKTKSPVKVPPIDTGAKKDDQIKQQKSNENISAENKSSPSKTPEDNKSSSKRKSVENVGPKESGSNKSQKTNLSNKQDNNKSQKQSPKNQSQEKVEALVSSKEKKSPKNVISSNEKGSEKKYTFKTPSKHTPKENSSASKSGGKKSKSPSVDIVNEETGEKPAKRQKISSPHKSGSRKKSELTDKAINKTSPQIATRRKDIFMAGSDIIQERAGNQISYAVDDATQTISKITYPTFFVTFHGKRVLCLNSSSGKLLLMREILRRNFKDLVKTPSAHKEVQYKQVYLAKERDLKITYQEIPEEHKSLAFKYLIAEKLLKEKKKVPQHLGVITLDNALRLYHYMNGLRTCSERCIEIWAPSDDSEGQSSELIIDGGIWPRGDPKAGSSKRRRGSCSSLDKANDGYESDVTIPYMDESEKRDRLNDNQNEIGIGSENNNQQNNQNNDSKDDQIIESEENPNNDDESENDSRLVLRGGVAECYGSYFRYIVVEGEKFYPYEDLVLKFGKIALTQALQSRLPEKFRAYKCTEVEADFINKLEETLPTLSLEATLLEEALFKKVASTLEFFHSNTIVDLTDNDEVVHGKERQTSESVNGLEVDLTEDDPDALTMDVDDINQSQDDSIIELTFDSPTSPGSDVEMVPQNNYSLAENRGEMETTEDIGTPEAENNENRIELCKDGNTHEVENNENRIEFCTDGNCSPSINTVQMENVKAPCDSTSNIGILGEMSRQISVTLEENNNDRSEPSSLTDVENNDLNQQFSAMLDDLEKEFSVSSGPEDPTEEEINQISHMQKMIEEAINGMATDMSSSGPVNDDEMDIKQAVKICMETFKESNKDITQKFLKILKQGVVYRAKFSSLKQQLTELKSGTDKVLSSCGKYEDMLSTLKNTYKGDG